jgi:GR25 family glycosyltransferase involved in LPS biosynthesis
MKKIKICVCHYPPLEDRKKYLDSVLPTLQIPFEFYSKFNRENINDYANLFSQDPVILSQRGWSGNPPNMSPSIKATTLEHAKIYEDILEQNYDYFAILEDDAVLTDDFKNKFFNIIDNLPNDWDVLHFSNGCGGRPHLKCNDGTNLVKMECKRSWTASGYLITKKTAKKFLDCIYPIVLPIDFELNFIQKHLNMNVFWAVDPLVFEGSNPVAGKHHKYGSSQIR